MIVFVMDCPSPYNTPVLNRLHDELRGQLHVFYHYGADTARGWGQLTTTHRHFVLNRPGGRTALANALVSPELRAVGVYGYRGAARIAAANVARIRGIPLVLKGDANVRDELARPALRRLLKRCYLRAVLGRPDVWTNGSANTAYWHLIGQRNLHSVPNTLQHFPGNRSGAVALRKQLGITDRFVFAFVGRLEPLKGVTDLLRAYDLVREATPDQATALIMAGRGSLEPAVRSYADTLDECHYLGPIPQDRLGAVYAAADIFVAPSHYEPWGWVVNEALEFGTRVIASDEVAAADDLCTEETGRRCPAADPSALAAAMLAEYRDGPRPAPQPPYVDIPRIMADRLNELTCQDESAGAHRLPKQP